MPFQKDIQNKTFLGVPLFVHKIFHVQKGNDMHMAGYTLIRYSLLYDSALTISSFFLSTRNLRIDKNYTLSIFMLSGSIQFYFNIQCNSACI